MLRISMIASVVLAFGLALRMRVIRKPRRSG
jgi:hypothetical protein